MMAANAFSLVGGGLEPAVAAYALRLNRIFGSSRVGWSVCGTFVVLALLHVIEPAKLPGMSAGLPAVVWLVVVVLLLIGLAHTEAFFSSRVEAEAHDRSLRHELEEARAAATRTNAAFVILQYILRRRLGSSEATTLKLCQEEKMQALGRMAGGFAHHFNNLLTPIVAYTSLLLEEKQDEPTTTHELNEICAAASRAAFITRQLQAFGGYEPVRPEPIVPTDLLVQLRKAVMPMLGNGFSLRTQFRAGLPDVVGDPVALERAVVNLVLNARDSMPRGGTITLSASRVQVTEAHADRVAGARAGDFVCLCVSDTGCGIAPEAKPHVFEPFFTTRDVGEAIGLGLSVAFGIAVRHCGWVELASEPGAGTDCKLYLPIARPGGAGEGSMNQATPLSPPNNCGTAIS